MERAVMAPFREHRFFASDAHVQAVRPYEVGVGNDECVGLAGTILHPLRPDGKNFVRRGGSGDIDGAHINLRHSVLRRRIMPFEKGIFPSCAPQMTDGHLDRNLYASANDIFACTHRIALVSGIPESGLYPAHVAASSFRRRNSRASRK
jgi:hypothetical protein